MQLLLATANPHKIHEIENLLADSEVTLISLRDYPSLELPEETGTTMAANARLKAVYCAQTTGLPSLADDSGIEVDFLNGEPGVYSARWVEGSDEDRTLAILSRLQNAPEENAPRVIAASFAWPRQTAPFSKPKRRAKAVSIARRVEIMALATTQFLKSQPLPAPRRNGSVKQWPRRHRK